MHQKYLLYVNINIRMLDELNNKHLTSLISTYLRTFSTDHFQLFCDAMNYIE